MRGGFRKGVSLNPKRLNQMMKQTGINVEELRDVEEVVIRTTMLNSFSLSLRLQL